jgi:signal transduction histidine kinase
LSVALLSESLCIAFAAKSKQTLFYDGVGEGMNLKGKIIIAFFIIIIMPLMLIAAVAVTIAGFQTSSIQETYDLKTDTLQVITNPIQVFNRLTRGIYNEIKLILLKNPNKLENKEYIAQLNKKVEDKYSFIMVRKNGKFFYIGDERKSTMILNSLPEFGIYNAGYNTDADGGIYIEGRNSFLVKMQDFYFSDGGEGTVFVITDLNILIPQIKALGIQCVMSFIVILCFTAFVLIVWIYRSIIRPLNILRIATNQIKDGDLNYSVQSKHRDEIGQLCEDFEDMRIRLKELIEHRLKEEEDIKELISNISHDLKTPLTAIKGYTEGLIDGVAHTPEKQEKYLKTIYTKANEMTNLVDELLFYAKIDSNTVLYTFKHININAYFEDCIEELRFDLEVKNIEIGYENDTDPSVQVMADVEQLKRVINNIIGNSIKYMDKKDGKIQIKIQETGLYEQIEIRDNGAGIPDNDIPNVFERFYRADASRNSKKGGSGLGLAIAKKIIEDHSGRIWAESEEGIGTKIIFTLKKVGKASEAAE